MLIAEQAQQRRERAIANRIKEACFRDRTPWPTSIGTSMPRRSTARRSRNWRRAGSSAARTTLSLSAKAASAKAGSSNRWAGPHVSWDIGSVTPPAPDLLTDLTARLADHTLPKRLRYYARFDWLIIDEFAFDKIERSESPQAANLLYKIIDMRSQRSTTVVTNIDFDAWSAYLDDPPLAMAFLDRVVDGAIILKINGKSYRAHRAGTKKMTATN